MTKITSNFQEFNQPNKAIPFPNVKCQKMQNYSTLTFDARFPHEPKRLKHVISIAMTTLLIPPPAALYKKKQQAKVNILILKIISDVSTDLMDKSEKNLTMLSCWHNEPVISMNSETPGGLSHAVFRYFTKVHFSRTVFKT